MTLCITTLSITTLTITALTITTRSIVGLFAGLSINDTKHNSIECQQLSIVRLSAAIFYCYGECRYAECHYSECRYAECRCAQCRGASNIYSHECDDLIEYQVGN